MRNHYTTENVSIVFVIGFLHNDLWTNRSQLYLLLRTFSPVDLFPLACLEDQTVLPVHQTYLLFENRIAYDKDFVEIGTSIEGEGARLGRALGDKVILLMGSHGCVTCGDSVAIALHRAYNLERHITFQVGKSFMVNSLRPSDAYMRQ